MSINGQKLNELENNNRVLSYNYCVKAKQATLEFYRKFRLFTCYSDIINV